MEDLVENYPLNSPNLNCLIRFEYLKKFDASLTNLDHSLMALWKNGDLKKKLDVLKVNFNSGNQLGRVNFVNIFDEARTYVAREREGEARGIRVMINLMK